MALCFWKLCDCPTRSPANPCTQHAGFDCSILNGQVITSEAQVSDPLTTQIEDAIARVDTLATRVQQLQADVQRLKDEVEREQRELEQQVDSASNYSERKAAFDAAERSSERIRRRKNEILQKTEDLEALINDPVPELQVGYSSLMIPYADPTGACACYQAKVAQLASLNTQITTEGLRLYTLQSTTFPTAIKNVKVSLIGLGVPVFAGIVLFLSFIKVVVFGIGILSVFPPIAAAIALLLAFAVILGFLLYAILVAQDILATRKRVLALILSYYRIQQIPTCRIPAVPDSGGGDEGGGDTEQEQDHDQGGDEEDD